MRIILESLSKELCISYVRHCLDVEEDVTAEGMLAWAAHSKNNNYLLAHKLCDAVLACSVMRAGVRRNNSEAMIAGRQKTAPIFFTGPHHVYQRLIVRDMIQHAQLPPSLKKFVCDRIAYSVSGKPTRGEGGDFVLEAKNRQTKSWLPPGRILYEAICLLCKIKNNYDCNGTEYCDLFCFAALLSNGFN